MRPLLGDFLAAASRHLDAATGDGIIVRTAVPLTAKDSASRRTALLHCMTAEA